MVSQFKPGDQVVFKSWKEMELQYGLNDSGDIPCHGTFTQDMEDDIDRSEVLTIEKIEGKKVFFKDEFSLDGYYISTDMIRLYDEYVPVEKAIVTMEMQPRTFDMYKRLVKVVKSPVMNSYDANVFVAVNSRVTEISNLLVLFSMIYKASKSKVIKWNVMDYSNNSNEFDELLTSKMSNDFVYFLHMRQEQYDYTVKPCAGYEVIPFNEHNYLCINPDYTLFVYVDKNEDMISDQFIKGLAEAFTKVSPEKYEIDMELCQLLSKGECSEIETYIDKKMSDIAHKIRIAKLTEVKKQFSSNLFQRKKRRLAEDLDHKKREAENYVNQLQSIYDSIARINKDIIYMEHNLFNEEIDDFFKTMEYDLNNIEGLEVDGNSVIMRVIVPFTFFDDDDVPHVEESLLSQCQNSEARLIVHDILHRKVRLWIDQGVLINFNENYAEKYNFNYSRDDMRGVPNPHIYFYNCWDMNGTYIKKYLNEKNYTLAYEQIKSALAGVNITEGPTTSKWMTNFHKWRHIRCLQDMETNEFYNFEEYLAMKEAKANENN